jgi:hypothetical protein
MSPDTPPSLASQLQLQDLWIYENSVNNRNYCGSWLASDEALTFNINIDRHTAFASKPAPTGFVGIRKFREQPQLL